MRKLLIFMLLVGTMSLFAGLNIEIDFETDVVGEAVDGVYTSEYFHITNTGDTAEYTIGLNVIEITEGWFMTWCHEDLSNVDLFEGCHHYTQPWTFNFPADAILAADFQINNMGDSEGMANFEYVITGGDLEEAIVLPFTFSTDQEVPTPDPLEITIDFGTDVVGEAVDGVYTSEYFQIANMGNTAEYTIGLNVIEITEGWFMTWCHEDLSDSGLFEGCHHFTQPWTFNFPADAILAADFQINNMGDSEGMANFEYVITGGDIEEAIILPFTFRTVNYVSNDNSVVAPNVTSMSNYPNPFNPETTISFSLKRGSQVSLEVFNILGQHVTTLVDNYKSIGNHTVVWNGKDKNNNSLSSGIYLYKLTAGNQTKMNKMILMK